MPYASSLEAIVAEFYSTMDDIFEVIDETIANATETSSDSEGEGEAIPTPPSSSSASSHSEDEDGFDMVPTTSTPSIPEGEAVLKPSSSEVEEGDEHRDRDDMLYHGQILHGGANKAYVNINASKKSCAGLTLERKTHGSAR